MRSAVASRNQTDPSGWRLDLDAVDGGARLGRMGDADRGGVDRRRRGGRRGRRSGRRRSGVWAPAAAASPSRTAASRMGSPFMGVGMITHGVGRGISAIPGGVMLGDGSRMAARSPVAESLARRTAPAAPELVETLEDGRLRCYACGHRCPIPEGREGVCRVRFREGGVLKVPWGYVGRAPVRSDREEAVLPRAARHRRALLRDARLRPALRVLPELVHLAVGPRPRGRRARRATSPPPSSRSSRSRAARRPSSRPTTSR